MVDRETIERRLVFLEEYCRDLTEAKQETTWNEFKTSKILKRYIERTLHLAIETCLDLGNHIISYEGYREPLDNKDIFQVLREEMIIDEGLAEKLKNLAQFRNIIVHDYVTTDPEVIFGILHNHVTDILDFAVIINNTYLS